MCFSATSSFAAAGLLSVMGVLTLKAAHTKELRLFASIPLFFALQQCFEGFLWITLVNGDVQSIVHVVSLYGFLFFAGVFWPIWIPLVLYRVELQESRKKIMRGLLLVGSSISIFYLIILVLVGSDVRIADHHITYPLPTEHYAYALKTYGKPIYYILLVLYLLVVSGVCFVSTFPRVWIFGLLVGIALLASYVFYFFALGSTWCYFSALISAIVYFVVKKPSITIA